MEISKLDHPGNITEKQYCYRARKVVDIFERIKSKDIEVKVMKYWLDQLLSHSVVEAIFESCDVLPPKHSIQYHKLPVKYRRNICHAPVNHHWRLDQTASNS